MEESRGKRGWRAGAVPLVWVAVAAAGGVVAADCWVMPWGWAVFLGLGIFLWRWPKVLVLFLVTGVFGLRHAVNLWEYQSFPERGALEAGGEVFCEIEGVLGRRVADSDFEFRVEMVKNLADGGGKRVDGVVRLEIPGGGVSGERLRVRGVLRAAEAAWNPGEVDVREIWRRKGIQGRLRPAEVERLAPAEWWSLGRMADEAARWAENVLSKELETSKLERTMFLAMTLGSQGDADEKMMQDFRDTGTMHLFSVSGLHVAMMGTLLWLVLAPLGLTRRKLALLVIPLIFGYALLTGWKPPAVRATVMMAVLLLGVMVLRRHVLLNSLALAALLLWVGDTNLLFTTGFQLSFSAVGGIVVLAPVFQRMMARWTEVDLFMPRVLLTDRESRRVVWRRNVPQVLGASVAATVATAPVMIRDFGMAAPVGLLANVVLIPLAFPVLVAAFGSLVSGALGSVVVSAVFNNAAWLLCGGIGFLTSWMATWPGAGWQFPGWERWDDRGTRTMLLCRFPDLGESGIFLDGEGGSFLIDAGGRSDVGRVIEPAMRWLGVGDAVTVLVTHGDAEHMGGVLPLVRKDEGMRLMLPPVLSLALTDRRLRTSLARSGQVYESYGEGTRLGRLGEVLWVGSAVGSQPADDQAAVLLFRINGWRVLWLGDCGYKTQRELLRTRKAELACDVVVKGNHRDDPRFDEGFFEACGARMVLTRTERSSGFTEVFERWAARRGVMVLDQRWAGAVLCDFLDEELRVRLWKGKTWWLSRDGAVH